MLKKVITLFLLLTLISIHSNAQVSYSNLLFNNSQNLIFSKQTESPGNIQNWMSRAFCYNVTAGNVPRGPCKLFLNTPSNLQNIYNDPSPYSVISGSFDGLGNYFCIRYMTNELLKIDTTSGLLTLVGVISGGNTFQGLSWDPTTLKMFALNMNFTSIQLGNLNTNTAVWTPIGSPVPSDTIISIAVSNSGEVYAHRYVSPLGSNSEIIKINKTNNAITLIGSTGFPPKYSMVGGMSWDRDADSCYLTAFNNLTNHDELRRIKISSGMTTLVGNLGPTGGVQANVNALAIPGGFAPIINHVPLKDTEQSSGIRPVNCDVLLAGSGINPSQAKLFYSKNNPVFTDSILMTNTGGNNWTANLTLSGYGYYRYYLKTTDSLNRIGTAPPTAPGNYYSFAAAIDTVKPVITHTAIHDTSALTWPVAVDAVVTDNISIDSVWVKWYKNSQTTIKQFRLNKTVGDKYSGIFNSTQSEVFIGDVIHYKIFARDSSSNHNSDSTVLYSFTLTSTMSCIGNGTIPMGSSSGPFNTYWYGNRTQMLYTKNEILENGYYGQGISRIAFYVTSVGGQAMNGFNINMQHTTMTTLSGFTTTGWTNVYSGTYTVYGTGWQCINLQNTFYYNSSQNLLIEICFGNTSYTTATTVLGTTMSGMEYSEYHDISTACTTFLAPTAQTARANLCINCIISETNSNYNKIPGKFSLSQNYPNPFNPVTRIDFDIPKKGFVSLKIYDVLGREIQTLVNEEKTAGSYSVDFNGSEFSSGVYFYRIESNGFSDVKRMLMIK